MPSLFLVCFGTRVFLCLLFSTQVDFEARTTKKYGALFLKGDCVFARQMLFPDWDSWLVWWQPWHSWWWADLRKTLFPSQQAVITAYPDSPIVKPAHVPAWIALWRGLFLSTCHPCDLSTQREVVVLTAERFLEKVWCLCLQVLEAFAWLMHLEISPSFLQPVSYLNRCQAMIHVP